MRVRRQLRRKGCRKEKEERAREKVRETERERESEGQTSKREMILRKKDVTFQPLRRINQAKLLKMVLKYRTTPTATQVIKNN